MNRIAWGSAIAVCAVLALASCNTSSQPDKQATSMADGQFVESFLTTQFATSISNEVPLVIDETLSMGSLFDKTHEQFANELIQEVKDEDKRLLEAVREFCQKNAGTNSVESIGSIAVSHVVLTADQMKALFDTGGKDGWTEFYKTYPKSPGIITLVVMALLIPVINREPPIDRTLTDLSTIELAVRAYHSEYNTWPQGSNNAEIIRELTGQNPRRIHFLELNPADTDSDGSFVDTWGTPYQIAITDDELSCRSAGENKRFEADGDDVLREN